MYVPIRGLTAMPINREKRPTSSNVACPGEGRRAGLREGLDGVAIGVVAIMDAVPHSVSKGCRIVKGKR